MAVGGRGVGRAPGTGGGCHPPAPPDTSPSQQQHAAPGALCAFNSRSFESTSLTARSEIPRVGSLSGPAWYSRTTRLLADSQRCHGRSVVTPGLPQQPSSGHSGHPTV
ncbi:hypothetical protein Pcinc_009327 [Petrolisthes cinctipes]|uniref:Uncharacterized protein n=1 Tax=Petrolisthes cinctipes TaxID=88211 RepID=A0AAE1G7M3_PETCI|nr:hypothetical protein Pcinc_009327 [Petrolisthes cinctipes]